MSGTDRRNGLIGNAAIKVPCIAATTAAITLSGEQTIDAVACVTGDRVLVKNQASGIDNGIYIVDTGSWERAPDFDGTYDVVEGTLVLVTSGTVGGDLVYQQTTASPVIGTSSLAFAAVLSISAFPISIALGGTGAATAAAARTALAVLGTAGGNLTGGINSARGNITQHATTMDFFAVTSPDILDGTGSAVTITGCVNAPQAGATRKFYPIVATVLTHGATFDIAGNANLTAAAGDCWIIEAKTASTYRVTAVKEDGTAVVAGSSVAQIQPISASVGASALTISASALSLDFRSATLTSGTVTKVSGTPANLVISSGSTLGTVDAKQSRIAVLAMNNAGTIELAAVNVSGGNDLTETGVISTTAEGGAGAADSANVIYSTTARSNLAYRVIGYIESTQATAGTWATAPSTIQGAGGNAVTAMSSLGYGQTWQDVTGSRAAATTYYNTTGRPIMVSVTNTSAAGNSCALTVNGVVVANAYISAAASSQISAVSIVPPGGSYSVVITGTIGVWAELR